MTRAATEFATAFIRNTSEQIASTNKMWRRLSSLKDKFMRETPAERREHPHFIASLPAALLLSVTLAGAPAGDASVARLIGSTHSVSAGGISMVVPSLWIGNEVLAENSQVHLSLDLYPDGIVELRAVVVYIQEMEEDGLTKYLVGVRIARMTDDERALYLEYLGTRGWERASRT